MFVLEIKIIKSFLEVKRTFMIDLRGTKYELVLPKLKQNYLSQLINLENRCKNKELPYQIQLDDKFIYISFEQIKENIELKQERFIGIDLNPEHIGISINEIKDNNHKVIKTIDFDVSQIIKEINLLIYKNK